MSKETNTDAEGIKKYKWEYKNFLAMVRERKPQNTIIYAQALGIDRRTLVHWMSQPELRTAMLEALDELVEGMKTAGKKDWRMHRELLNMLGVTEIKNVDIKSDGEKINVALVEFIDGNNKDTDTD